MKIKTTMRYLTPLSEWLLPKSQQITNAGEDVEKKERLCTLNVNWYNHCRKQFGGSL